MELYRKALARRRGLQGAEELQWHDADKDVLHFSRPGGWNVVANFGAAPVALPEGEVLLASAEVRDGKLPGGATAWIRA